ncbi:unnamed protein product, partial [Brassica rapa subsp. narinosa]
MAVDLQVKLELFNWVSVSRALQNWDPHMRTALPAGKQDIKRIVKSGYNVPQLLSVCPVKLIISNGSSVNYLSLYLCLNFHWF